MTCRKLSIEQVREIRASKLNTIEIMAKYRISQSATWKLLTGFSYKEDGMITRKMPNRGREQKIFKKDKEIIKQRYFSEDGLRYRHLAAEYGVGISAIEKVINGA